MKRPNRINEVIIRVGRYNYIGESDALKKIYRKGGRIRFASGMEF